MSNGSSNREPIYGMPFSGVRHRFGCLFKDECACTLSSASCWPVQVHVSSLSLIGIQEIVPDHAADDHVRVRYASQVRIRHENRSLHSGGQPASCLA